jgi:hypothetical protein
MPEHLLPGGTYQDPADPADPAGSAPDEPEEGKEGERASNSYSVDCNACAMRSTVACDDCVVSFIVSREPGDALVIDVAEERAVRMFQDAGLVPRLRHVSRL